VSAVKKGAELVAAVYMQLYNTSNLPLMHVNSPPHFFSFDCDYHRTTTFLPPRYTVVHQAVHKEKLAHCSTFVQCLFVPCFFFFSKWVPVEMGG